MGNYYYNGVELPAPPEWDKTKYPYAFITRYPGGEHEFIVTANIPKYESSWTNGSTRYTRLVRAPSGKYSKYSIKNGQFTIYKDGATANMILEYAYSTTTNPGSTLVWSNTNVARASTGAIYFYASDPVPVPPKISTLAPAPMLMGWHAARRILGMLQDR